MLIGLLLTLPADAAAGMADGSLELRDARLTPTSKLTFEIQPGAASASKTVYLRRKDGAGAIENVRLNLELTSGSATITREGGASAGTPFTVPSGADETLQVSVQLPAGAQAEGTIVANVGGRAASLASVTVRAATAAAVAVAENREGIKRTATTTDYTLFLTLAANEAGAKAVQVLVPELTDPAGSQVPVTVVVDGRTQPIDLAALGTARVSLTAQLPRAGDYTGGIVLVHDGRREAPVALTITRTQVEPTVEILTFTSVAEADDKPVVLEARLHETSGSPIVLSRPVLVPLGRKEGDSRTGPTFGADDVTIELVDVETHTATPVEEELPLDGGEDAIVRFTIADVGRPGDYGARLRIAAPTTTARTSDVSYLVRLPAWWAAIIIFVGVFAAFIVREVVMKRGARARQGLQLRGLLDDLSRVRGRQPDLDADALEAFAVLDRRIADLYATNGLTAAELADRLDRINLQITLLAGWLSVRRRLTALRPPEADPFRGRMESVRSDALNSAITKASLEARRQELLKLQEAVDAAVRRQLRSEIETLKTAATEAATEDGHVQHPAQRAQIEELVVKVLDEAAKKLDAQDAPDEKLLDAARDLATARGSLAAALLEDLQLTLTEQAPEGVDEPVWIALRDSVHEIVRKAGIDAEQRLAAYRQAFDQYLTGIADAAHDLAKKRHEALTASAGGSPSDRQKKALEKYAEAQTEAQRVRSLLVTGALGAAHAAYRRAVEAIGEGDKSARTPGVAGAALPPPPSPPAAPPPADGIGPADVAIAGRDYEQVPDQSKLGNAVKRAELGLAFISVLFAVILGVSILYVPNETWGDLGDKLLALLWGIGLYEVAGQTIHGYRGVQTKLTAP